MDYLCAKFDDFSYSRFSFIMQTDRQTESHTEADDRYTHATLQSLCMSNSKSNQIHRLPRAPHHPPEL